MRVLVACVGFLHLIMAEEFAPIQTMRPGAVAQRNGWRRLFGAPVLRTQAQQSESGALAAQVWVNAAPWRVAAGWAALAGLLASGFLWEWQSVSFQRLVLLWLLVDPLWGALWRLAGGRSQALALPAGGAKTLRLPYLQSGSPAAQLLALDESNALPYLFRIGAPTLALASVVALALGNAALLLTLAAALITALGWAQRRTWQRPPLLLQALVTVALPWLLALWEADRTGVNGYGALVVWLGVLWTIHHWGELRSLRLEDDRLAWIALGAADIGMVVLLIVAQAPFWLPILAILMLPTWLAAVRKQSPDGCNIWWLAALFVSALAVGQIG